MISSNISSIISNNNTFSKNADVISANNLQAQSEKSHQENKDITKALVDNLEVQKMTESNTQAIKSQDTMIGSLLDIKI